MANDPEGKERAKRRCTEGHEAAGVTQEAVDAARKLAKLVGWLGEKLAAPNPPPTAAPITPPVHPESLDAAMKNASPPETTPPAGQGPPAGRASQAAASAATSQASAQGVGGLQGGTITPT